MKEIHINEISDAVEKLCTQANYNLNNDVMKALKDGLADEESDTGRDVLEQLVRNAEIACREKMAICQDTGMAVVFVEVGQEVHIIGGSISDAINNGVRRGYKEGYLRKSVVQDPLERKNTGDNTPAIIYYDLVEGDSLKIDLMPKGFGSENMSAVQMLKPSDGLAGVKAFVIDTVDKAGPNPCPPIVVGVGIGGTMEKAAMLSKRALLRPLNVRHPEAKTGRLEAELLECINKLGIGPAGLGGRITALGVNVETFPTHIAGLPVAVNISCHALRHAGVIL